MQHMIHDNIIFITIQIIVLDRHKYIIFTGKQSNYMYIYETQHHMLLEEIHDLPCQHLHLINNSPFCST